jgi:putative iron-regulated protein
VNFAPRFRSLLAPIALPALTVITGLTGTGCGSSDDETGQVDDALVVGGYADHALAGYSDSVSKAEALLATLNDLVESPSEDALDAARTAWLAAREPYGQTEVYRFYEGPIDNADTGPEGRINAWPLDEAFIDYVKDEAEAGIINAVDDFPTLSEDVIAGENEKGGEKNIATGYHAIEFLLWGQDLSETGPGERPATDYESGASGIAKNQDRRGEYLKIIGQLLVDDLESVQSAWEGEYGDEFAELGTKEALRRMLLGMGSLAGAELSGERMTVALDNKDQEDEHSCFSDNTARDLHLNALGIQNVFLGRYGKKSVTGIYDLVKSRDAALADKLKDQLEATQAAIDEIPAPFDRAIVDDDGREKVDTAVRALQAEAETIVDVATLFDIEINLE